MKFGVLKEHKIEVKKNSYTILNIFSFQTFLCTFHVRWYPPIKPSESFIYLFIYLFVKFQQRSNETSV